MLEMLWIVVLHVIMLAIGIGMAKYANDTESEGWGIISALVIILGQVGVLLIGLFTFSDINYKYNANEYSINQIVNRDTGKTIFLVSINKFGTQLDSLENTSLTSDKSTTIPIKVNQFLADSNSVSAYIFYNNPKIVLNYKMNGYLHKIDPTIFVITDTLNMVLPIQSYGDN